jgi:hypothetical protein
MAKMTKLALLILFESNADIWLYDRSGYCYPMLQPADMNGATHAKIGQDIRLIEIIPNYATITY